MRVGLMKVRSDMKEGPATFRCIHTLDRPEFLGGCDLWESWDS